jgi:hypothetical protein
MIFNKGDKVLTCTGKTGFIINIRQSNPIEYYVLTDDFDYQIFYEYMLKIDEKYYKTLLYNRKKKRK